MRGRWRTALFFVLSVLFVLPCSLGEETYRVVYDGPLPDYVRTGNGQRVRSPVFSEGHAYAEHQVVVYLPEWRQPGKSLEEAGRVALDNGFWVFWPMKSSALAGYYIFERPRTERDEPHALDADERVGWWQENTPIERVKRSAVEEKHERFKRPHPTHLDARTDWWTPPSDPLYARQWHLSASHPDDHVHIDAQGAWKQGYTGLGVSVAVVDDGLEKNNPDLSGNVAPGLSWDFNGDDDDPSPAHGDSHGTSASGVAAATRDTTCGVGVAYDATLVGFRLLGSWETDATEADALGHRCTADHAANRVDVYSCSWGPTDDGKHLSGPGRMVSEALAFCAAEGRAGLGSIYVWAGGNGRLDADNSNYDGFANSIYTIAVGAVNQYGEHTWYSEPGANLVCVAPSSGMDARVITTDLKGRPGASEGDCTKNFGGTSAAAPEVAGVVALILQANARLNWREVQDVLAQSSANPRHAGITEITEITENAVFTENAAGYAHSHDLGFGMVNANQAVQVARGYAAGTAFSGEQKHFSTGALESPVRMVQPQHSLVLYWEPDDLSRSGAAQTIAALEHVTLTVSLHTPARSGCLGLALIGPSGVNSTLHDAGNGLDAEVDWTYMTVRHWGEPLVYDAAKDVRQVRPPMDTRHPARWSIRVHNLCVPGGARSLEAPTASRALDRRHHHHHQHDGDGGAEHAIEICSWRLDFYGH